MALKITQDLIRNGRLEIADIPTLRVVHGQQNEKVKWPRFCSGTSGQERKTGIMLIVHVGVARDMVVDPKLIVSPLAFRRGGRSLSGLYGVENPMIRLYHAAAKGRVLQGWVQQDTISGCQPVGNRGHGRWPGIGCI